MEHTPIAQFTVTITATENASWQGTVEMEGQRCCFRSEMELLRHLLAHYPSLWPDSREKHNK